MADRCGTIIAPDAPAFFPGFLDKKAYHHYVHSLREIIPREFLEQTREETRVKGRIPADLKGEGEQLAHSMGYHWATNTDPDVPFDGFMYRGTVMVAVRLMKVRYGPGEDCIIEKKYPDIVAEIRSLPVPPFVIRELWLRTQNERAFRRFYILPDTTAEIEESTAENYRNTHYRETYWKKAPYRIDIPLRKREGEGAEVR